MFKGEKRDRCVEAKGDKLKCFQGTEGDEVIRVEGDKKLKLEGVRLKKKFL